MSTSRYGDLQPNAVFKWKGRWMKKDGVRAWSYPFEGKYPYFLKDSDLVELAEYQTQNDPVNA